MASSILSPQSQILPNIALTIFAAPGLASIAILLNPSIAHGRLYGLAEPQNPQERTNTNAIWRIFASRDMFMASAGYMVYLTTRDRRLLGMLMWMTVPAKVVDGAVVRAATGRGYWEHWGFVPVFAAVAAGLMGWLG